MTEAEFRDAVWFGLGRAMVYARIGGAQSFKDVILDACLQCHAIDPQTEGTRPLYMYELVSHLPDQEVYFNEVVRSLGNCQDDWHAVHRFRFASYLTMDGSEDARRAMYKSFRPGPSMCESTGCDFIQLDGIDGLLFAARKTGELLLSTPQPVNEGFLWSHAVETLGRDQTYATLHRAARTDHFIAAYLEKVQARLADEKPSHRRTIVRGETYAEIKPRLLTSIAPFLSRWGGEATTSDLESAAHDLLAAETPEATRQYLFIFRHRAFPLGYQPLLDLLGSSDDRVSVPAAAALANISEPPIRGLASRLIESNHSGRHEAILMLARNPAPEDPDVVVRMVPERG